MEVSKLKLWAFSVLQQLIIKPRTYVNTKQLGISASMVASNAIMY